MADIYTVGPTKLTDDINAKNYEKLFFRGINKEEFDNFKYTQEGKNLVITYSFTNKNTNELHDKTVTLTNYFGNDSGTKVISTIKTFSYGSGNVEEAEIPVSDINILSSLTKIFKANKNGVVSGTVFSDTMDSETINTAAFKNLGKKNKGLTINGGKGKDEITGTQYNDTISGGVGVNTYNYDFGAQSGQDIIKLSTNETLILNLKNGENTLKDNDVSYAKLGNDLIIYLEGASQDNQLDIKNFFKAKSTVMIGDDKISDYLSSTDFKGLNILGKGTIKGTQYNDIIQGSASNDTITAGLGNDTIYTNGGKSDTVVETGDFGHDIIDSFNSQKVTVKIDSFDKDNISFNNDGDLIYTKDENSSFTYSDYKSGNAADLWIKDKKKSYHILNLTTDANLTTDKNNKVIYMSGEDLSYNGSKKGINVIYSSGVNSFNYQGANDTYLDSAETDDTYSAVLNKSGSLVVVDNGGEDSLTLKNNINDLSLFYNIDSTGANDDDLVIYHKGAISYKNLVKAYKNDSYSGAVKIDNYFSNGNIENISYDYKNVSGKIDISGWRYYVETMVKDWLKDNNKTSAEDVLLNGTNKEKSALTAIYKNLTYGNYQAIKNTSNKYSDMIFESQEKTVRNKKVNILNIYAKGADEKKTLLYSVKDFLADDSDASLKLLVTDDNGELMSMDINAQMEVTYNLGNDNKIIFNDTFEPKGKVFSTLNNSNDTLVFNDKAYADFYTKSSEVIAYNSGDPLIKKDGNDLKIGEVTVKDTDGLNSEIMIVDKNNETKNIIIGQGEINGTFESEIIIGSNSADVISSNGNNDLIYMGGGNDTLNITSQEKGEATGKNTAKMTGIGGTTTIEDDLKCPAISVYSDSGDDTYNTSFDYGLYIEDFAGNDTLNIKYNDESIMYFFDVVNPNKADTNPTLYTDLMICDKGALTTAIAPLATQIAMAKLFNQPINIDMKAEMENLQGKFGYAWIDDYYGGAQKIETVNLVDENNEVTKKFNLDYTDTTSDVNSIYQQVSSWLSSTNYDTAWDVLEKGSKTDMANLLMIYMGMNQ